VGLGGGGREGAEKNEGRGKTLALRETKTRRTGTNTGLKRTKKYGWEAKAGVNKENKGEKKYGRGPKDKKK